jgi:hypothetical protein
MQRRLFGGLMLLGLSLGACSGDGPTNPSPELMVRATAGSGQTGTPGIALTQNVEITVTRQDGSPVVGMPVTWNASDGGALFPTAPNTDGSGRAEATWRLGLAPGEQEASVILDEQQTIGLFHATAEGLTADSVTGGGNYICIRISGSALCKGINPDGNLGDGSTTNSPLSPVPVTGNLSWTSVVGSTALNSCGIAVGGAVFCWGNNANGATGTGMPALQVLTPAPIASTESFTMVDAAGFYPNGYACGISTQQRAFCWGFDQDGRLGTGSVGNRATPTPVADTLHFASIYTGDDRTCALTPAGDAWCWGMSYQGTLGSAGAGPHPTPVPVAAGFSFIQLAVAYQSTCGLEAAGDVYCWGVNFFGGLGNGSAVDSSATPLPVSGGIRFQQIVSRGDKAVFGLAQDGQVYYWGSSGGALAVDVPTAFATALRFRSIAESMTWGHTGICGIEENGLVYCGEPFTGRIEAVRR